ncbi:MAG: FecR domain-containing protein [Pirellulaceae bacterium]|nr:FecR domain-containing protein [Pirellulaceae bacterium]
MSNSDLEQLIAAWLDGRISESESEALQQRLNESPEARTTFHRYVQLDAGLREAANTDRQGFSENDQGVSGGVMGGNLATPVAKANPLTSLRILLAIAGVVIVALTVGLYVSAQRQIEATSKDVDRSMSEPPIAKITGLTGSLTWTGDRGQIIRDVKVGSELDGGTIEGMAPDSWFELKFNDGSTVMIAGTSTLTFSDFGQKELHLKRGRLAASVVRQPEGKPMLIHTRSAVLKVLGTRFEVETKLDSTSLFVSEGTVQLKRRSDGRTVEVPAQHRVVTSSDGDMSATPIPSVVHGWKSQLHLDPADLYGKWSAPASDKSASLKAIPFVPQENKGLTLHLLGLPVNRVDDSPVVVQSGSRFLVRGRLQISADLFFGIRVARPSGDFAGKFLARLPAEQFKRDSDFQAVFHLDKFGLDPCVWDRKDELPSIPDDLVVTCVWAFTHTGEPTGLEVTEIELIPLASQTENKP